MGKFHVYPWKKLKKAWFELKPSYQKLDLGSLYVLSYILGLSLGLIKAWLDRAKLELEHELLDKNLTWLWPNEEYVIKCWYNVRDLYILSSCKVFFNFSPRLHIGYNLYLK